MNLVLLQYNLYEADRDIRCDATEMFFDNAERKEICFTHNEVAAIFWARFKMIYPNEKAIYIELCNNKTGNTFYLNCRKAMHELMMKYLLYPTIIQNALKQ